jgi:hypothetical protein
MEHLLKLLQKVSGSHLIDAGSSCSAGRNMTEINFMRRPTQNPKDEEWRQSSVYLVWRFLSEFFAVALNRMIEHNPSSGK